MKNKNFWPIILSLTLISSSVMVDKAYASEKLDNEIVENEKNLGGGWTNKPTKL